MSKRALILQYNRVYINCSLWHVMRLKACAPTSTIKIHSVLSCSQCVEYHQGNICISTQCYGACCMTAMCNTCYVERWCISAKGIVAHSVHLACNFNWHCWSESAHQLLRQCWLYVASKYIHCCVTLMLMQSVCDIVCALGIAQRSNACFSILTLLTRKWIGEALVLLIGVVELLTHAYIHVYIRTALHCAAAHNHAWVYRRVACIPATQCAAVLRCVGVVIVSCYVCLVPFIQETPELNFGDLPEDRWGDPNAPMPGERRHVWYVFSDSSRYALPDWYTQAIDVHVAQWAHEHRRWTKLIMERNAEGKELTPRQWMKFEEFLSDGKVIQLYIRWPQKI